MEAEPHLQDRATAAEVIARLTDAHAAMIDAAEALSRRYGASEHVIQIFGAAAMIRNDWIPEIKKEPAT